MLRETKARLKDSKWSNVKFEKEFDRKEKNESEIDDGCKFSLRTGKKKGKGEEVGERLRNLSLNGDDKREIPEIMNTVKDMIQVPFDE